MADTLAQRRRVDVRLFHPTRRNSGLLACYFVACRGHPRIVGGEQGKRMGGKRYPSGKRKKVDEGRMKEEAEERSNRLVMARILRLSKHVTGGKGKQQHTVAVQGTTRFVEGTLCLPSLRKGKKKDRSGIERVETRMEVNRANTPCRTRCSCSVRVEASHF